MVSAPEVRRGPTCVSRRAESHSRTGARCAARDKGSGTNDRRVIAAFPGVATGYRSASWSSDTRLTSSAVADFPQGEKFPIATRTRQSRSNLTGRGFSMKPRPRGDWERYSITIITSESFGRWLTPWDDSVRKSMPSISLRPPSNLDKHIEFPTDEWLACRGKVGHLVAELRGNLPAL